MRIAAIERFSDPSRRCAPEAISAPGDEVLMCDLPSPFRDARALARAVPGAVAAWLKLPLPLRGRWELLRSCLGTGGARLGALVMAPELVRRVRAGEVGAVACYSSKDFALVNLLARETGLGCREVLARGTQYFGEFAFELLAVIPYAYWLHTQGRLDFTVSTPDTRCLYYFSKRHEERPIGRGYVPITEYPLGERGTLRYDRKAFPADIDISRWLPPPYGSVYRDTRFAWDREPCIVSNKATNEQYLWHRAPTNFIDTERLLDAIGRLRTRYQVIYNRPRGRDIVNDHQAIRETGDIEAVKGAFPDVLTIQELHARHPDLGFNELQLRLYAGCRRFVSVLGGGAYLASYFGGTNVVYARRGWEVASGAYERWFDRFSGARVVAAGSPGELVPTIERELL